MRFSVEDEKGYMKLTNNLEDLVKVYRGLLTVVRAEKDILVSADLDDLNGNNKSKEKLILALRKLEKERIQIIADLVQKEHFQSVNPSLLELANFYQGIRGDKLRNMHSVLELLIKRVKEFNLQNEILVKSALSNISGAINSIKEVLEENKTYQEKGSVKAQPAQSGQLVSREA